MNLNKPFFRLALGADVVPSLEYPALSGSHTIGADLALPIPAATVISFSRVIFSGATGRYTSFSGVDVTPDATPSTLLGTAQKNSFTSVAPDGVEEDGFLRVLVKFIQLGAERTFSVPVARRRHTDANLINKAIFDVISLDKDLEKYATMVWNAVASRIEYTKIYAESPSPLDPGVANSFYILVDDIAVTSLNTIVIAGSAGVLIQRLGPVGADIYAKPLTALGPKALFCSVPPESLGEVLTSSFGVLTPGSFAGKARGDGAWPNTAVTFSSLKGILDVIQIS